jgi:hypothetical protein
MRLVLLIVSCCWLTSAIAQDDLQTSEVFLTPRFQVGVEGSIGVAYRTLFLIESRIPEDAEVRYSTKGRNNLERPKVGYTVGVVVRYNFSRFLAIESGMRFQNMGYHKEQYTLDNSSGRRYLFNLNYLEAPFKVKAFVGKGNVRFTGGLGVAIGALVQAYRVRYSPFPEDDSRNEKTYGNYRPYTASALVQLGVDIKAMPGMTLGIQPEFRYAIVPAKGDIIVDHMWSAGFNVSILFGLKRKNYTQHQL